MLLLLLKKKPGRSKYITTPEFNKIMAEYFAARMAQANLASKNDIANFVKKSYFDDKLNNLNKKKILQIKQNIYLLKMNEKNYWHLTQVTITVKVTLIMMEHNFISYFSRSIII